MIPAHSTLELRATLNMFSMGRNHLLLVLVFMALLLGPAAPKLHAQGDYMGVFGLPPDTTALPIENGFMNLADGTDGYDSIINLEFPFGSWPQRAGNYSFKLTYSNAGGWKFVNSNALGYGANIGEYEDFYTCESEPDTITETVVSTVFWYEANGTAHEFDVTFVTTHATVSCGGTSAYYGTADSFAKDGTGFRMKTESGRISVYAPDGTRV